MVARIIKHRDKAIGKGDGERKSCCDQAEENKTHWAYGSTQIGSAEAGRRNLGKDQEAPEPLEQFGGRVGERACDPVDTEKRERDHVRKVKAIEIHREIVDERRKKNPFSEMNDEIGREHVG